MKRVFLLLISIHLRLKFDNGIYRLDLGYIIAQNPSVYIPSSLYEYATVMGHVCMSTVPYTYTHIT